MNIDDAKALVIKAGIKLVDSGLIARTWGNVSCRISDTDFVITPSGRDYKTLTPDQIVSVKILDCSYTGEVKPSAEKGIHAEVYKLYPNINFVIHTHQENASVISASELDSITFPSTSEYLSSEVLCAGYGLPGTKKLRVNVSKALSNTKARAVIMKHHGALCFGENFEETFETASQLEDACFDFISARYLQLSGKSRFHSYEMGKFALASMKKTGVTASPYNPLKLYDSKRTESGFILFMDTDATPENLKEIKIKSDKSSGGLTSVDLPSGSLPREASIYNSIYKDCSSVNYILHKATPEIIAVANSGILLKPLLDDFAQIAGTVAKNIDFEPNNADKLAAALKKSSVVLIPNYGALCCGKTRDDAVATELVTQKACKALIGASILGKVNPINPLECMLMRFVYSKKYSKQIDNKHR